MDQQPAKISHWLVKGLSLALLLTLIGSALIYFHSTASHQSPVWPRFHLGALGVVGLALLLSWLIEGLRINLLASGLGEKIPLSQILRINLATAFIGNITPFSSGGVPTQIYLLCRSGMAAGKASAVVAIRVVLSALLFTSIAPFLLLLYYQRFAGGALQKLTLIAIPLSSLFSVLMITLIIWPVLAKNLGRLWLKPFLATKLAGRLQSGIDSFLEELEIFHQSLLELRTKPGFYLAILSTIGYWATFFAIGPLLIYAFGLNAAPIFWETIIFQFILVYILAYLPVPGSSGVMELSLFAIFIIIPVHLRAAFVILWRFISYYITTFVGGVILVRLLNRPAPQSAELPG